MVLRPGSARSGRSLVDDGRFRRLRLQERGQIVFVGQFVAVGPCRALAQGLKRLLRAVLGLADDAGKTAVAHDGDETGDRAGAVFAQLEELCARVVRPQHAAMQHAWQRLIVDEARPRKHLVGNVDPLHRVSGQRALRRELRRHAWRRVAIERDFVGQFPIAGPDIAGPRNRAVLDAERIDPDTQPFRSQLKKDLANFGAGMSQRAAGLLDREAARGDAFVGARWRSRRGPSARGTYRHRVRRRRSAPARSRCPGRSRPCRAKPSPVRCSRISAMTTVSGSPRG